MNRHHPYGGYDERATRGGRGGGAMGRPARPAGGLMSPPPPSSAYPQAPATYNPASAPNENNYYNTDPYAASNDFSGGADRHYNLPSGPMSTRGGRGGMPMRGGFAPRPPPSAPLNNSERPPPAPYAYDASTGYEAGSYAAQNSYDPAGASSAYPTAPASLGPNLNNHGRPPYNPGPRPPRPPSANPTYGADYANMRPPANAGPSAFQDQSYGAPTYGNQYAPAPGPGPRPGFGGPRPPPPQFGGGRGGKGGKVDNGKPCRTLFVRNVQFETDSKTVKEAFEQFGEIKTFFDMVNKRGIAFITYYDIRAAHAAMEGMKGAPFGGRPIDIHYSVPREEDKAQRCDRDKNQGTLFTILKQTKERLTDDIIYQVFSEFGDVKSVRPYKDQINCRFVEFFDSRACQLAHDKLNGQQHMGGEWELKFAWDLVTADLAGFGAPPGAGVRPMAGPSGAGWARPPPQQQPASAVSDRAPLPSDYPSFDDSQQGAATGYAGAPSYGRSPVPPTGPPVDNGWGNRASATPRSQDGSTPAPQPQPDAARLEQAQKVQQLLASLGAASKGGAAAVSSPIPSAPAAAPTAQSPPPTNNGGSAAPGLPANIAALLQQASGAPKPAQPPKPQSPPSASPNSDNNGQQSMHQLLSMLNQNRPPPSS